MTNQYNNISDNIVSLIIDETFDKAGWSGLF